MLELDTMGVGTKRVNLTVVGERATFSENVRLLRDRVNRIRFECNFAGSLLIEPPPPPPLEIYCDGKPPECTGVYIEEETSEGLSLEVQVSEPLSSLSARLLVGEVAQGEFHDLALQSVGEVRRPVSYFVRVPFLYRELSKLQFRMTDLAGRTSIMKLPLYRQLGLLTAGAVQDDSAGGKTTARTEDPRLQTAVGIIPRSAFLKEMGLIFVPFGDDRLQQEMSRTELPDRVWQLFLRTERGLDREKDERSTAGDPLMPMVLGDQPVTAVRDFVKWFQERANDGYVYFVPTVEQWLCAFTDTDEEQEARQALEKWFDRRFEARPEPRYGVNKPYAMGLRLENMTLTGMLDMESNLQELVVLQDDRTIYAVIGAHNQLVDAESIKRACLHHRKFDRAQQPLLKKLTGLRLCRRPRRVRP